MGKKEPSKGQKQKKLLVLSEHSAVSVERDRVKSSENTRKSLAFQAVRTITVLARTLSRLTKTAC